MTQQTVLVTGASGFLASHCIEAFLASGWNVVGTVRNLEKSQHLLARFPTITLREVKDLVTAEGLTEALEGVDAIAHTASPYQLTVTDPLKDFIEPAVNGTLNVLKAATAKGIKRVVVTSSFAAVTNFTKGGAFRDYTYTSEDWNPTTLEVACEPGRIGAFVYSASKTLAEHAALDYGAIKENNLEVVTMNPPMIYGLPNQEYSLASADAASTLNTSTAAIYALITGPADRDLPGDRLPLFCEVSDVARAHVKALEAPSADVAGKRFLLCGGKFTWLEATQHLQAVRPELADRLPKIPAPLPDQPQVATLDCTPAETVLGMKFQKWQQVLESTIDALVAKEKA